MATEAATAEPRIVYPEPYGIYVRKRTSVSLWVRVRMRTMVLFSVDRTPYEMALVFEALQDANIRIAALESKPASAGIT